ncbi:MAG: metallophosphoesterase, partial [Bacteroidales bacterium]|nr:metallophosphoesterase [Bacteroidales bacterium]
FYVFLAGVLIVIGLNVFGHLRAIQPVYKNIKIPIKKKNPEATSVRLALISDVHLGTIIGVKRLSRIVERINKINPDAVIIAGDLVDEDIQPVIRKNMGRYLEQLKSPVFAVTGNHEYIGGVERSLSYLKKFNIRYLRDEWLEWNGLILAGREDRDRQRYTGKRRETIKDLLKDVDHTKPVILIDHQPLEMNEKQKNGVDFTISGHTHNGQSWPLNFITKASFQVSYGYTLWENMHVYVSSGVGGWGPPVRIGTRAEIVQMDLEFL